MLDTNILISAALAIRAGKRSVPRRIFEEALILRGVFEHFTSPAMLYELADVLSRPAFGFIESDISAFVSLYVRASTFVSIEGLAMGCRDRNDDKVLETAMNGAVDFIVCRDADLFTAQAQWSIAKTGLGIRTVPIRVVSDREFLQNTIGSTCLAGLSDESSQRSPPFDQPRKDATAF